MGYQISSLFCLKLIPFNLKKKTFINPFDIVAVRSQLIFQTRISQVQWPYQTVGSSEWQKEKSYHSRHLFPSRVLNRTEKMKVRRHKTSGKSFMCALSKTFATFFITISFLARGVPALLLLLLPMERLDKFTKNKKRALAINEAASEIKASQGSNALHFM